MLCYNVLIYRNFDFFILKIESTFVITILTNTNTNSMKSFPITNSLRSTKTNKSNTTSGIDKQFNYLRKGYVPSAG